MNRMEPQQFLTEFQDICKGGKGFAATHDTSPTFLMQAKHDIRAHSASIGLGGFKPGAAPAPV